MIRDFYTKLTEKIGNKRLQNLALKYREQIMYVFFGGLTTIISIVSYWISLRSGLKPLTANILSWICAVGFAFVTNKTYVFTESKNEWYREILPFYGGRLATLLIQEGMLFLFIKYIGIQELVAKMITEVVVIILNYVIGKKIVFAGKNK